MTGRGVHRRAFAHDGLNAMPHVSNTTTLLVFRERRQEMTWAILGPRRGIEHARVAQRAATTVIIELVRVTISWRS